MCWSYPDDGEATQEGMPRRKSPHPFFSLRYLPVLSHILRFVVIPSRELTVDLLPPFPRFRAAECIGFLPEGFEKMKLEV